MRMGRARRPRRRTLGRAGLAPCTAALAAALAVALASGCGEDARDPRATVVEPSTAGSELARLSVEARRRRAAVVWAVGDGADGGAAARSVAAMIARSRPDRLLYLGDVYQSGTAEEFRRNFAGVYGRLAPRTAPTPGNHEWANRASGYGPYWRRVTGAPMPAYYAFGVAGWEILSLNSETAHGEDSPQLGWLRARVRRGGTCRIAFWHRPRYSRGRHGNQVDVEPFWRALAGRASIVVNAHDHDMQRFRPLAGITQLVAGAGGHGLYPVTRDDPRLAFADDRRYGALRLELRPRSARYAFVAADGRTLDAGSVRCRR